PNADIREALKPDLPPEPPIAPQPPLSGFEDEPHRPTPTQVGPEAPEVRAPGSLIMKVGAHQPRPLAPQEGVAERLVGIGARDGDAPLPHGIGRAEVGPREQARASGSAAHARFT